MREKISLDKKWLFHRGEVDEETPTLKKYAYLSAKTERAQKGPASVDYVPQFYPENYSYFNRDAWKWVDIPHDYIIEMPQNENENMAWGYLPYENAWYIKYLEIPEEYREKRISLFFEGVAIECEVYLNGVLMHRSFTGYTPFEIDISDIVKFGEKNKLAVYCKTQNHEGWWYDGAGIYRHVDMIITDKVSVDLWGVYAKPVCLSEEKNSWNVEIETTVRNDELTDEKFTLVSEILTENGKSIGKAISECEEISRTKCVVKQTISAENPKRWSPDSPVMYKVLTKVLRNGTEVDKTETRFGFRTYYVDCNKGLFINGKHYKIYGMNGHADCGLFGKAVPDSVHRYKVQLLKEMGVNGYRTSHYFQADALMNELDENGFIVYDEARWYDSTPEGLHQTEALIKRDRNRPSVFFWGIGNEERYHETEQGLRIFKSLKNFILKMDNTRIITAAVNLPQTSTVYDDSDIIGINYRIHLYSEIREKYPDKAFIAPECCATGTTRDWYFPDDDLRQYIYAKDHKTNANYLSREDNFRFFDERDWIIGFYQWIAFEHRGESVWPRVCSQSGSVDLFMQKKDAFYQNKSHFTKEPMVHLLPHWNFKGFEGHEIEVAAFTNQPYVELFLNGKSLGKQSLGKIGHGEWKVVFEEGTLEVKAYDEDGKLTASDRKVTSGKGYKLKLCQDTTDVYAEDFAIFTCSVEDENGNEVYDAEPLVRFMARGDCKIYSTGSDISEHGTIFNPDRRMKRGRIGVAVKLGKDIKNMEIVAMADGLVSAVEYIKVKGE